MSILKTSAALSLAVLISFGAAGCTKPNSNIADPKPSVSQTAENQKSALDSAREESVKTLNEINQISKSGDYLQLLEDLKEIDPNADNANSDVESLLAKHAETVEKIDAVISWDADMEAKYGKAGAEESGLKLSDKTIASMTDITALGILTQGDYSTMTEVDSYGVTSAGVVEKDGVFTLKNDEVYLKDKNGGILSFADAFYIGMTLEDGGKKIVLGEPTVEEFESNEVLTKEVANAAEVIEYWRVSLVAGKDAPIVLENGALVSPNEEDKGKYKVEVSPGLEITVEGNSNVYVITGTDTETGEKVVYNSANGGMKSSRPDGTQGATAPISKNAGHDYAGWMAYQTSYGIQMPADIDEFVDYLNSDDYNSEAKFEVVERNGQSYVKVDDADTKILEDEVLYVSPFEGME